MARPRLNISYDYLEQQLAQGLNMSEIAREAAVSDHTIKARISESGKLRRLRRERKSIRRRRGNSAVPIISENHDWQNDALPPEDNWRRVFSMNAKGKDVCVLPLPGGRYTPGQKPRFIPKTQFLANYRPVARQQKTQG